MSRLRVSLIGAGIMGAPMARNVAKAGFRVRVWNRSHEKARSLRRADLEPVKTLSEAYQDADIIIFMLSTGPVVDDVLKQRGPAGTPLITRAAADAIIIVMSSIPADTARAQAAWLSDLGFSYIDCPVSGGEAGAQKARLTLLAGGDTQTLERATPVLRTLGRLNHLGPVGCGQAAKLANQAIVGISIAAISEAFLLAQSEGIPPAALRQALAGGFADSAILQQHGKRIAEGNFAPGAKADVQLKDLRSAADLAHAARMRLSVTELVCSLYEDMCASERAELDHAALYLHLRDRAKLHRS